MLPGQRDKSGSMAHVSPPSQGAQPCPGECMKLAVLKGQALPSPSFCAGPGRRPLMWRAEEEEWPCARAASQERNEPLLPPAQLWVQLMGSYCLKCKALSPESGKEVHDHEIR